MLLVAAIRVKKRGRAGTGGGCRTSRRKSGKKEKEKRHGKGEEKEKEKERHRALGREVWREGRGEREVELGTRTLENGLLDTLVGGVAVGRPRATAPASSSCRRPSAKVG